MNKYAIALLALSSLAASAVTVKVYKAAPQQRLAIPVNDTAQLKNRFSPAQLLDIRRRFPTGAEAAGWTTMVADSTGTLQLVTPETAPLLNTLSTRISAPRFTKGKLVLRSTARANVKVNGETKIEKTEADSLPAEQSADIQLAPDAVYDIAVNLLTMPDDKSKTEFSLEFVPDNDFKDVEIKTGTDVPRRVQPLTTMIGERTYRADLSPDGKYLLSCTREVISATDTRYHAEITETASGKTVSADVNYTAQWMPSGSKLYYAQKRGEDYEAYLLDVPSMKTSLLASGLPEAQFTVSPDGRYLFYYDHIEGEKPEGTMRRIQSPDDRIPGDRDRDYIVRYDLESGIALPITYGGPSTTILDFTRDGSKMLYLSSEARPDTYPFYFASIIQMDMNSLATDTIVKDEEGFITDAKYSPDGRSLFVTAHPDAFGKIGANYGNHEIGNNFDNQGYILDIATGNARAMTRDFDPALQPSPVWNRVDGMIYFLGEAGFGQNIYRLNPKDGKITQINADMPFVRSFSIGENEADWLVYVGGSFTEDGVAGLVNLRNGKSRIVADPLAETTEGIEFGKMEQWKFTADDGTEIDGWFCLPPQFDPSRTYPLIVYYYGGTNPSNATFYHLYSPQVFASRDYVVYVVNPSGTTGYGQEFSARHVNTWGKRTAEDIIQGVKKFCATHPYVNSKKIGCIGASYGGFMTQYLQTQTDIFAAAVSHAGISNVTSYWGEGFWGYSYNSVAAAKSYPWSNPDLFTKQGSLFNADKIHTPLLLLHGTVDTNVPIGESIQLFNALRVLGRDVEFITVEGENHVIQGFEAKQLWQNTIMAWFAKYLQDDPRWWNALYGK